MKGTFDMKPTYAPGGRRLHSGGHPETENTCDDPQCWCHGGSHEYGWPELQSLPKPMKLTASEQDFWKQVYVQSSQNREWTSDVCARAADDAVEALRQRAAAPRQWRDAAGVLQEPLL